MKILSSLGAFELQMLLGLAQAYLTKSQVTLYLVMMRNSLVPCLTEFR